jgi:hypothetical protein
MKRWQVLAVLALLIAVNVSGYIVQRASNGLESTMISGNNASSEGLDILNVPLNPTHGNYYRCEISSLDNHRFTVLFTNTSELMDARINGSVIAYIADRSVFNVTSATLEGHLPGGSDIYELVIVSAEPGVVVPIVSQGEQAAFPPSLQPALQAANFVCWISNISLLFLLVYSYDKYRTERRMGH